MYGYKGQQALFAFGSLVYQKGCKPESWVSQSFSHIGHNTDEDESRHSSIAFGITAVVLLLFFIPVAIYIGIKTYRKGQKVSVAPTSGSYIEATKLDSAADFDLGTR
jgi:hypothetical protein